MEIKLDKQNGCCLLKRLFSFAGRATRKEFWLTYLGIAVAQVVILVLCAILGRIPLVGPLFCCVGVVAFLALIVADVAVMFRRLHDLGLSGFWTCYLSPMGLPFIYCAYIMDADESAKAVIERIKSLASPWLSWILSILFWPAASSFGMLLILLSPGQREDNRYGANPYVEKPAQCEPPAEPAPEAPAPEAPAAEAK